VHVALYRVSQEALNNVARHAHAESAWVDVKLASDVVRLSVRDDGDGFEPRPAEPTHLGMQSIIERAEETGAELSLESAPGQGTEIVVEWRLDEPGHA
jgi:signal transduction histidine kinase